MAGTLGFEEASTGKDLVSNTVALLLQKYLRIVGLMIFQKIKYEKYTLKQLKYLSEKLHGSIAYLLKMPI